MTSSDFQCKSDSLRSSPGQDQPRTSLNDLTLPPKACAVPSLSKHCAHCGPIRTGNSTNFRCGNHSTIPLECPPSSTTQLAPKYLTTKARTSRQLLLPGISSTPAPILIPPPTLSARDINRVSTPLSGRSDRKGHLFPYSRSPSPRLCSPTACSRKKKRSFSNDWEDFFGHLERIRSASPASPSSTRSHYRSVSMNMHNESLAFGRYPTSPLSPKPPSTSSALSPQTPRRGNHGRQTSRNMQLNLGRYHPSNFAQADAPSPLGVSATSTLQTPKITYARAPAPVQVESPRLLREKHREFIEKARQSSKLAASPFAIKPDAPRLDPLGSPHGAVTPLALEEAGDYFTVGAVGQLPPVTSPGARSPRAASMSSDEDQKPCKSRKVEA